MDFAEIVNTLNDAMGTDLESLDETLMFDLDGIETVFQSAGDRLIMTADLGSCEQDFLDRLTCDCLKGNYMFSGTRGSSLALNPENGHLFLQRHDWLDRLTREKLIDTMDRFTAVAMEYAEIIRSIRENHEYPEDSSAQPSPSSGFAEDGIYYQMPPQGIMV
ncbi:type III secretion system chaperone [Succinimonas sp.]|uniref:type III secretion system chaperone n=1 Tax=Succinimonas sp. TaxID=1936151 RepID=UPI00386514E6